jgi:hypothetical protein
MIQFDMFGATVPTTDLYGLKVRDIARPCRCGDTMSTIEGGTRRARIICDACGDHSRYLPKRTHAAITNIIRDFGMPNEPFEVEKIRSW